MAYGRSRRRDTDANFWPGFVDALSTLLLVFVFLLSIFMLAQFYVSQESSGKDSALAQLNRQLAQLTNLLSLEKGKSKAAADELAALQATISSLEADNKRLSGLAGLGKDQARAAAARIGSLSSSLEKEKKLSKEALSRVDLLNQQILAMRRQLAALEQALEASERKNKRSQTRITNLGKRLNVALARKVQELQRYRSDFFGRLRELLANRKDIQIVGDRFVFQSEVLFPSGQATMSPEGLAAIDQLANAIIDLSRQIPPEINWALQVDGHTDARPIKRAAFPSNWELSTARAISVVRYLIARGVPANRLVAAGHGEFSPLVEGNSEEVYRRNRRIELKLTNR